MSGKSESVRLTSITKSLKNTLRPVFTAWPKHEFVERFPDFTPSEQEGLYRIYTQTISWFPENIEKELEELCVDMQAGEVFDTVEQLVEEQSLDPLYNQPSNVKEVARSLTQAKREQIEYLMKMAEMAEKQKGDLTARLEVRKSETRELKGAEGLIDKLRMPIDY